MGPCEPASTMPSPGDSEEMPEAEMEVEEGDPKQLHFEEVWESGENKDEIEAERRRMRIRLIWSLPMYTAHSTLILHFCFLNL